MDRSLTLHDASFRILLVPLSVLLDHLDPFDDHTLAGWQHLQDLAAFAAFRSSDHHHFVVLLYMLLGHNNQIPQITSGASEMIFMNFLSRNSRATGPKMRVPRGLFSLSII